MQVGYRNRCSDGLTAESVQHTVLVTSTPAGPGGQYGASVSDTLKRSCVAKLYVPPHEGADSSARLPLTVTDTAHAGAEGEMPVDKQHRMVHTGQEHQCRAGSSYQNHSYQTCP